MVNSFDENLYKANDFFQGLVDMIPLGRTIVDGVHSAQQYYEPVKYDYNQLTNKDSNWYIGGQVAGVGWNLAVGRGILLRMRALGPVWAGSKLAPVARLGALIANTRAIKSIDAARIFMESMRAFCYTFKLWCNQTRLKNGRISRQQFDKIQANDLLNYQMGGVMWALPGTGGLYLAGLNMMVGTIMAQSNMDTVAGGKK